MRFLFWTLVILLLAVGAAWYFNWITFTVGRNPEGSVTGLGVNINRDRIQEDVEAGRRKVASAADAVKKEVKKEGKEETVRGTIRDAKTDRVTLDVAGKAIAVRITGETKIKLEGRVGAPTDLQTGQDVRCSYVEQGGDLVGREITVLSATK